MPVTSTKAPVALGESATSSHLLSDMTDAEAERVAQVARFSSFHCVKFSVFRLHMAPPEATCPHCGKEARRCGTVQRGPILDASLDGPVLLYVDQGVYRCRDCSRTAGSRKPKARYFRFRLPFTVLRGRYTYRARRLGIDGVKLDGLPFTKVVKRLAREFLLKPARATVWRWHDQEGDKVTESLEYRQWAREELSGVLCIDELYDGEFCVLTATDPIAQMTVGFQVLDKKGMDAAKMGEFLAYLTVIGAKPDVIITDESKLYPAALRQSWPDVLHQLCEFHFIRHLVSDVIASVRTFVKGMPKNPKRRRGRPAKLGRPRVDHNEKSKEVNQKRFLFAMNPATMSDEQATTLSQLIEAHPELSIQREFMLKAFSIFESTNTPESAERLRQEVLSDPRFLADENLSVSVERLKDDTKFEKLTLFLHYENLDKTNNDVERDNRRFRKKQKSHYRLRTARTIRNALFHKIEQEQKEKDKSKGAVSRLRPRTAHASNPV